MQKSFYELLNKHHVCIEHRGWWLHTLEMKVGGGAPSMISPYETNSKSETLHVSGHTK